MQTPVQALAFIIFKRNF
jgi:hypothetical protein